jgi:hypothetical protein
MAAIGNVGTFATTQPIQGDPIGRAMGIVEQNAFRYRKEEDEKAKEAQKLEDERQKGIAELAGDYDYDISGFSSIDDPVYNFAMEAKENVATLQQKMLQNPNMSQMEIADYKRQIAKQDQSFKYLKQFPTLLKAKVDGISKGIAEGKYHKNDWERLQNEIKNLETGKFKLNIDKNGNPKITVYEQDDNGNYTKVIKETGLGDYVNSLNPRKAFDYGKSLDDATKGVKGKLTARQTGVNITEKLELTPEIVNSANSYANFILRDADNRSIMEEQFGVTGNDLRKKVVDDYLARVEQKDIQKLDSAYSRLAYDQEKDNAEKQVTISEPSVIIETGNKDGVTLQKGTKSYPLNNAVIKGTGGKEQRATNIYVSPGGKMYLRVENSGSEGASKKVTRYTEKGLKRQKEALANKVAYEPEFDDIEDVTITDKAAEVEMLDFGKDNSKIGEIAGYMGYKSAAKMQDDFIARSGFDIKPPKFTFTQEKAIQEAIRANPGYSRQEIINALGIK